MARLDVESPDNLHREAQEVAIELGVEIETLARSAFEGYMDGVRDAPLGDLDEDEHASELHPTRSSNVSALPPGETTLAVEGTEDCTSTEVTMQVNFRILTEVRHLAGAASNFYGITLRQVMEAGGHSPDWPRQPQNHLKRNERSSPCATS